MGLLGEKVKMFEKEIKFIADFNLNKIRSFGSFITFEKLLNSGIHPAVLLYISAELDYLIVEDRKKLLQQSVFDYSGPEVSKYFNLIGMEVKKSKKISFEDLKKLIIQAVSFNLNYIVRPRWSLIKLVFNEADHKSVEEIKLTLNYVYYYDYIKNIFLTYITKRKLVALSLTEFELILIKIDKELFSNQPQKLVDNTLFTIGEFLNLGGVSKNKIPILAAELFLKEKNLMDYLFRLRKAFPQNERQTCEVDDIKRIIFSNTPVVVPAEQKEEETPKVEEEIHTLDDEEIETVEPDKKSSEEMDIVAEEDEEKFIQKEPLNYDRETAAKDDKKNEIEHEEKSSYGELSLDSLIDDDLLSLSALDEETKSDEEKETDVAQIKLEENKKNELETLFDFEEETNNVLNEFSVDNKAGDVEKDEIDFTPLEENVTENIDKDVLEVEEKYEELDTSDSESNEQFNKSAEDESKNEESNIRRTGDILDFINDKDIAKIVSNVFNEDKDDFKNTLEKLNECNNYEEATEILKSVFITYRVNPYSREAVTLTNSVATFFARS